MVKRTRTIKTRRSSKPLRAGESSREVALKRLKRMETRIVALLDTSEGANYEAGKRFDAIARAMLYRDAGFETLEDYANARFNQGYRTLRRYRRVANAFAKRIVIAHGMTKLDLALRYIAITPEDERPMDVLSMQFPTTHGKNPVTVRLAKASERDLETAIDIAQSKPTSHDTVKEARAKRIRDRFQRAVAAPKGKATHAPLVRAHVHDETGKVRIDLVGIDEHDLVRVLRAALAEARRR